MLKAILYVFAFGCIFWGAYEIYTDNQKGLGVVAFVFSVFAFLVAEYPFKVTTENRLPTGEEQNYGNDNIDRGVEDGVEMEDENSELNVKDNLKGQNSLLKEIKENSFGGSLLTEDEKDCYKYVPAVSGRYRFEFESDNVQNDYYFYMYSANKTQLASTSYIEDGVTVDLISGEEYIIEIEQDAGYLNYTINIGVPNDVNQVNGVEIVGYTAFVDQVDRYMYVAPISGQYRFDFESGNIQANYNFYLYSSINQQLASTSYIENGVTVELIGGEQYYIEVEQDVDFTNYMIDIGVPNAITPINASFSGKLRYKDQLDRYTYIAPRTGRYRFDFECYNVQNNYKFYMYALDNQQLASTSYVDGGVTVDLIVGQEYRIEVEQEQGFEKYNINIGVPNDIVNLEGDVISGIISYIEQENVYKYKAVVNGEYYFNFETNDVSTNYEFFVVSPENLQLISTSCARYEAKAQLEAGKIYTIIVKQDVGFPIYKIGIEVKQGEKS